MEVICKRYTILCKRPLPQWILDSHPPATLLPHTEGRL